MYRIDLIIRLQQTRAEADDVLAELLAVCL